LSELSKTRLVFANRGQQVGLTLSRSEFEELTADLLERTRVTTKLVLNETGLEWADVDKLLLSGGSTRMPEVARMLRGLSGLEPDRSMSPDEAVAHGAAIYQGILRHKRDGNSENGRPAASVVNVNAHSLGLVTRTRTSDRLLNSILIPRNTPLPHSGSRVFHTGNADQKRIEFRILEGEALDPDACSLLGRFLIDPLPSGLPAGSPVRLHYSYDESGRIRVQAAVDGPSVKKEVRIARRGSTVGKGIDDWAMGFLNQADSDELVP
jgi:molecular chaperone DnaK